MAIHDIAARGYQDASDAYERGRPSYPSEAVQHLVAALGIREGTTILDLGAGTGKLTALLEPSGARLVAVEPVEAMRRKLADKVPRAAILDGVAEDIPLPDASVDAVVVAQAFHWFDGDRALAEIYRVLTPGGRLGLIWNARDESVDWVARLAQLVDSHAAGVPRYRTGRWRAPFEGSTQFTSLAVRRFRYLHRSPPETVIDRVASVSFISALSPSARENILADVRSLLATHLQTSGQREVAFPYSTDVFVCSRTS